MKCTTTLVKDRDEEVGARYVDRPCEEAATEYSSLEDGLYARYGTSPTSIYMFMIVMGVLAYLVQALLV